MDANPTPDQSEVDAAAAKAEGGRQVKVAVPEEAGNSITVRVGAEEPITLAVKAGKVTTDNPDVLRAVLGGVPGANIA